MEMRNPSSSSSSEKSGKKAAVGTCGNGKGVGLKKGPWTAEEDEILSSYIRREGEGKWRMLPKRAGLLRCGKSCRLRWMNYLRPSVKRGHIAADEEDLILRMHRLLGNRWSLIAGRIPGRTDNEIKNYWNTHLSKKLISLGIDPTTHKPLLLANNTNKPPSSTKIPSNKPPSTGYHFPMPSSTSCNKNVMITTYDDHLQHRQGKLPMTMMEGDYCCYDGDASCSIGQGYQDMMLMIKDYCDTRSSHENIGNEDDDDDAFSSFLNSLINEEAEHHHHQQQQQVLDAKNPATASGSSS